MEEKNEPASAIRDLTQLVKTGGEVVATALTGIPPPFQETFAAILKHFGMAVLEVPVAYAQTIAGGIRHAADSRRKIRDAITEQIVAQAQIPHQLVEAAVSRETRRMLGSQLNLHGVLLETREELQKQSSPSVPFAKEVPQPDKLESTGIDLDWVNEFEELAARKSSPLMQKLFGRILAGEIRKPATFSIKALKIISDLDTDTAHIFRTFCSSCALFGAHDMPIRSGRVISFSKSAGENGLAQYGLTYFQLTKLAEHGLINYDFGAYSNFAIAVMAPGATEIMPLNLGGSLWVLRRIDGQMRPETLRLSGPGLTQAGAELAQIVEIQQNGTYIADLKTHLLGLGYHLTLSEIRGGKLFVLNGV